MKYDTIVIGAGSAGAIVATRLSEDPGRSVLLLEAGPDYPNLEHLPDELKYGYATGTDIMTSDHNWQFIGKSTDTAGPLLVPRGKVTGGSSAINGQVFLRGVPEDYEAWAAMGNNQWAFQELTPYFRRIEADTEFGAQDIHNADGPIIVRRFPRAEWLPDQAAFYTACRDAGFDDSPDHNAPDVSGVGAVPLNNPDGIRWSTALGYLNMARHRLNFTIKPNCTVHRLRFAGQRVTGVEVESGGERFVVEGEEIVLSGGAIGSPHILMLSGVGPAEHLREVGVTPVHDLPGVGTKLARSPHCVSGVLKRKTRIRWTALRRACN